MENVFFHPRVGKNYETLGCNGLKLLILGESHYCSDQCDVCGIESKRECNDFTSAVLNRFFKYKKGDGAFEAWMRTFTRFTNVFLEDKVDYKMLKGFWDSVIFYNYVQSSTHGPRITPTSNQFKESEGALAEILEKYKPDLIIVWGDRLWRNLPDNGRWGNEKILENEKERFYYFKVNNNEIPAYSIYHPSTSYFNYGYSKYLKEAIRLVSKPEIIN